MSRKSMALSVIVVVIILIVSSVAYTMLTGTSGDRKSEIETSLTISEPPSLNNTAKVTFTFSVLIDITNNSNARAEIFILPVYGDGFEWIGEPPKWSGDLMEGDEIVINGTIKSIKEGNWTITAAVYSVTNDNYSLAWDANYDGDVLPSPEKSENISGIRYVRPLYISVSEDTSYISEEPFPEYKPEGEEYPITQSP